MARPEFEPTETPREVVKALMIFGVPLADCCSQVINPETGKPISYKTFTKVFADEIATAVLRANAAVLNNLLRIATSDKTNSAVVSAIIFYLRTRDGWRMAEHQTTEDFSAPTEEMIESEA